MSQQAVAGNQLQPGIVVEQGADQTPTGSNRTTVKNTIGVMSKRQKRLFSMIVTTLIEHGNLDGHKAAVIALAKEAKVNKLQLKEFVELGREKHPEINQVARVDKLIKTLKKSGKQPSVSMFEHLQPEARRAGKDDIWLSERLGFMPPCLQQEMLAAEKQSTKKSLFRMIKG